MNTVIGPTAKTERIASLDVLRGFAVLGILVMNIQVFSMPHLAYFNPTSYGDFTGANYQVWLLSHVFVFTKFRAIFAMLFGAGIILLTERIEARGHAPVGVHYRRMGWLILFGLLHAYLLWAGDILYLYGVCGLIVYLFRKKSPGRLFLFGIVLFSVSTAISLGGHYALQIWPPEQLEAFTLENWQPPPEMIEQEIATYRGSWTEQMDQRLPLAIFLQTFVLLISRFWEVSGLMLMGMALFKLDWLSAKRSVSAYLSVAVGTALLGFPIILYGVYRNISLGWEAKHSFFLGPLFNTWPSIPVAIGWISVVMLACKRPALRLLTRPFAAVGQMAFTNYIMQTIICTTIFYGHGFGLFGQVSRVGQIQIVVAIWIVQLIYSPIWLHYFRFGLLEWLWRSLTYWRWQPMRRVQPTEALS